MLRKMRIVNLGCIGPEGVEVEMDDILCLVGPNNTGKSTILRAYELVAGTEIFVLSDRCQRAVGDTVVELWAHIPEGIENIAEKWKEDKDDYKIVRTRWSWDEDLHIKRETWDPEIGEYSQAENASGVNTVFQSRLPAPFRIGALENPEEEHRKLLTLILQPIADKLKRQLLDQNSDLSRTLNQFKETAQLPVQEEGEKINKIANDLGSSHGEIFPNLSIGIDVNLENVSFDPLPALLKSSGIKFIDFGDRTTLDQQGTGSQRALFWAMLQVRSKLKSENDLRIAREKQRIGINKDINKLELEIQTAKKDETKERKRQEVDLLKTTLADLPEGADEESLASLPGYMLLIDEPEIALHPSAIRAASRYLYALAQDSSWQVMMTTHSPAFVNPIEDHTTIIRLDRNQRCLTPHIYRSDTVQFSDNAEENKRDKETLKMLNKFDSGVAELFFGQYPILVEGDTEFTAFEGIMNKIPSEYPLSERPAIIRARGKDALILLIKMLKHLKINFSIIHDSDFPKREDGAASSAWSANSRIMDAISNARSEEIKIIHRVAIPYFEKAFLSKESSVASEKPWNVWQQLDDHESFARIRLILDDLKKLDAEEETHEGDFMEFLGVEIKKFKR